MTNIQLPRILPTQERTCAWITKCKAPYRAYPDGTVNDCYDPAKGQEYPAVYIVIELPQTERRKFSSHLLNTNWIYCQGEHGWISQDPVAHCANPYELQTTLAAFSALINADINADHQGYDLDMDDDNFLVSGYEEHECICPICHKTTPVMVLQGEISGDTCHSCGASIWVQ